MRINIEEEKNKLLEEYTDTDLSTIKELLVMNLLYTKLLYKKVEWLVGKGI